MSLYGLAHYWPLDEASGATVTDTVGEWASTVIHDDAAGTDTVVDAWIAKGRNLAKAGANHGYIRLWNGAQDLTYSLTTWSVGVTFAHPDLGIGFAMLWTIGNSGVTDASYVFVSKGEIGAGLESADTLIEAYPAASVTTDDGNPHQAIFSCDGTSTRLYYDGALVATVAAALPLQPKQLVSEIGGLGETGWNAGWVDEVQIWDRALGATDAAALWNDGTGTAANVYALTFAPPDTSWADTLTQERVYYACDISDGVLDTIRVPISSWQATIQADRSSFVQAVVPGLLSWIDAIEARPNAEFVIRRGVTLADGSAEETELARAPLRLRYDRGPTNATGTLSGYSTFTPRLYPLTRALRSVRSISVDGSSYRVRCAVDFFLRPGDIAIVDGEEITLAYINYIVGQGDEYMDVGTRAL